jgi:hypothetical protein
MPPHSSEDEGAPIMAFTPVRGKFCKIEDDAGTPNVYAGVNWTLDIDGNATDTSNFRDGRRSDTTLDNVKATFSLIYDETTVDAPDNASTLNIRPGEEITMKFYVNNGQTKFFQIPLRITKVTPKVENLQDVLKYEVEGMQNGTLTWPVHA